MTVLIVIERGLCISYGQQRGVKGAEMIKNFISYRFFKVFMLALIARVVRGNSLTTSYSQANYYCFTL